MDSRPSKRMHAHARERKRLLREGDPAHAHARVFESTSEEVILILANVLAHLVVLVCCNVLLAHELHNRLALTSVRASKWYVSITAETDETRDD
jgi:hypothetical protein